MLKVRNYLPAVVLLIGCGFVWNMRTQAAVPLAAPLSGVLASFPGYSFRELHLTDEERRILGNTDYVARVYAPGQDTSVAFTTFVSYYERQTQGKTIHSPRNCLPGAGWEVLTVGTAMVPVNGVSYQVNRYQLKNGPETAVVYYWYQGRGRVVANEYAVKWNLLRDAAIAGHTEEALVRVMVPVLGAGKDAAEDEPAKRLAVADSLGTEVARRLIQEVSHALPGEGNLAAKKVASGTH